MISRLISALFGCSHPHSSRSLPIGKRNEESRQICLSCGKFRFYAYGEQPGPWTRAKQIERKVNVQCMTPKTTAQLMQFPIPVETRARFR